MYAAHASRAVLICEVSQIRLPSFPEPVRPPVAAHDLRRHHRRAGVSATTRSSSTIAAVVSCSMSEYAPPNTGQRDTPAPAGCEQPDQIVHREQDRAALTDNHRGGAYHLEPAPVLWHGLKHRDRRSLHMSGILAVLDGSKALRKAVTKVFGERALVQRCTLHKRRNAIGYLPVAQRDTIDRRLAVAFARPDPVKGMQACRSLAAQLDGPHPDAAAHCAKGSRRCSRSPAWASPAGCASRSLTNTNCIESMISITRTTTGRVKHRRDGTMKKRWIAAGMLEAERSFRRLRGHIAMPALIAAVAQATTPNSDTPTHYAQVA